MLPPLRVWILPWLVAASPTAAPARQDPAPRDDVSPALAELGEGPLENDVFLPVAKAAETALARGDEAYARRLAAGADDAAGWIDVIEPWHDALAAGARGDSVSPRPWTATGALDSPWPDPDGTAGGGLDDRRVRRTESLADAVLRRLLAVSPAGRKAWTERFAGLASDALAAAGRAPGALAEVERLHPATPAACRAALALAELELEAGRGRFAGTWLDRAGRHAELTGDADLAAAVQRRRAVALAIEPPAATGNVPAWRTATSLEIVAEVPLEDLRNRRFVFKPRPGVRVEPDAAWLDDGGAAIQTEEGALVLRPSDGRILAAFSPLELLQTAGFSVGSQDPPREPPGWPARPATDGTRLVLALRTEPSAVACVSLGPADLLSGPRRPHLDWAVCGGARVGPDTSAPTPLEGWPAGEVQPGPIVIDDTVVVAIQQPDDESGSRLATWLVALDLGDGSLRWSRLVARGAPLARSDVRFLDAAVGEVVAQPLTRLDDAVLVGTHLGAAALVRACDGRPAWTFVYRRSPGRGDHWSGAAPPAFEDPLGALLAPADSDRAYWLRGRADLEGEGLLLHAPLAIDEAEVLLGASARRAVVLTRSGRERALAEWDGVDGSRREAPWLGPGEVFTGGGAVAPERVLFATDRALYLHDRERELYLLDHASYPHPFPAAGGRVVAHGDAVLVLGPHVAWVFRVR